MPNWAKTDKNIAQISKIGHLSLSTLQIPVGEHDSKTQKVDSRSEAHVNDSLDFQSNKWSSPKLKQLFFSKHLRKIIKSLKNEGLLVRRIQFQMNLS